MGGEVAERDGMAEVGDFGDVVADVVVEREQALVLEHGDGEGRELLRDRGHVVRRRRRVGRAVLNVGEPVAARENDLAALNHGDDAARGPVSSVCRHERVADGFGTQDLRTGAHR